MTTPPLLRYERLLARLFQLRALANVSDAIEAMIAEALNDCRSEMTEGEEARIGELILRMRGIRAQPDLGLEDTAPGNAAVPRRAL